MSSAMDKALLQVDDLSVSFPSRSGPIRAVRHVSFSIRPGEIVALVGESGSGKSTTGLAMMRLLQSAEITGSIRLARKDGSTADLLRLGDRDIRSVRGNDIAMIFQEPMSSLDPVFTIGTQMREATRVHQRISFAEAHKAAVRSLAALGLADPEKCMRTFQHLLSGGMRQRVMIAMSLASHPSLLIADEPTTALDVTIQAQIVDHLKRLQQQTGMAILFITHNLGLVAEIADRALVMYAGELVETGNVRELFANPRMPYTHGLLRSLPRLGHKRQSGERIRPIPGSLPSPLELPRGCTFHPRCGHSVAGLCDADPPSLETLAEERKVRCVRWKEIVRA
jgi:oligopeptide/dipeptide ABC transporter ATP-binding protein